MRPRTLLLALAAPIALLSGAAALTLPGRQRPVPACAAPEIHIHKSRSLLELRCAGAVKASYPTTFGASPTGNKERRGDERTPEGTYRVTAKVETERFHRFLALSYPNTADRRRAHEHGIQDPGGGIGIHGTTRQRQLRARAWIRLAHVAGLSRLWGPTDGCVGLSNEDVEALYDSVPVGARVSIEP